MEQNDLLTLKIPKIDSNDVNSFCKLNEITEMDSFLFSCFKKGYYIEKYGLLSPGEPYVEEKIIEVIKEIPVEKIIEVEKIVEVIKEVPVEKIVEVIKEVPVEKIVEVEKIFQDDTKLEEEKQKFSTLTQEIEKNFQNKMDMMSTTLQNLRKDLLEKDKRIKELEDILKAPSPEFLKARYLKDSNLGNSLQ